MVIIMQQLVYGYKTPHMQMLAQFVYCIILLLDICNINIIYSHIAKYRNDIHYESLAMFPIEVSQESQPTNKPCTEQYPQFATILSIIITIINISLSCITADFLKTENVLILRSTCHQQGNNQKTSVYTPFYELC